MKIAGEKYNLISATTLSGTPELYAVDSEGNKVAASNGKAKDLWLANRNVGRHPLMRLCDRGANAWLGEAASRRFLQPKMI